MADQTSMPPSKPTRQPVKFARPSSTTSSLPTPMSNANAPSSQANRANAAPGPRPPSTSTTASSRSHMRTRSANGPPPLKQSAAPSPRHPSAPTGLHRTASTNITARATSHNTTASRPLASTPRTTTTRAAHSSSSSTAAFTTYNQDFTSSRRSTPTTTSTTTTTTTTTPTAPPAPRTTQLRTQTNLLHLSLLHARAPATQKAYLASAKHTLAARFAALAALYARTLLLARAAQQTRNLAALRAWSGANAAALTRRLSVLTGVLAELMALTAPAPALLASGHGDGVGDGGGDAHADGDVWPNGEDAAAGGEAGEYTKCVARFDAWAAWVRDVWAARDAEGDIDKYNSNSHDEGGSGGNDTSAATAAAPGAADVQIEGLGDGTKAALRALAGQLHALQLRLQDLGGPPGAWGDAGRGHKGKDDGKGKGEAQADAEMSTPAHVLAAARALVGGMLEELQVMREVEFEVVVGEQAWMEERVRRIEEELDGF